MNVWITRMHFSHYLQEIQSVQNAAARLIAGTQRCEHIAPCSPAEVALASCSSTSWIEVHKSSASVVGWTNTSVSGFGHSAYRRHWMPSASERMCRSTHATFSMTEVSLLPVLVWNALLS